tara:strand:+ start:170 stop:1348 length:1179 start_codon:yes stop_codon:yes gene_type:complete
LNVEIPEIYLDAAATTPPLANVLRRMEQVQRDAWANPSSLHSPGLIAAEALGRSRAQIAAALNAESDQLIFTSGATESVHLALLGASAQQPAGRLVISAVEHPAVEAAARVLVQRGWSLERWPVDATGVLKLDQLDRLLAPPTRMVSLIWAQSEVGTLQPLLRIGGACRERGVVIHTDATQLLPQGLIDWSSLPIDLLSFSSHKLQGPRGVGLLLHRQGVILQPLQGGGGQEGGHRAGTEPVALIAGLAEALQILPRYNPFKQSTPPGATPQLVHWRDRLEVQIEAIEGVKVLHWETTPRLPNHLACLITTAGGSPLPGRRLVRELSRLNVACSSGSACRSGTVQDSAVLSAMGVETALRQSLLRFSLGPWIDLEVLDQVSERLQLAIQASA